MKPAAYEYWMSVRDSAGNSGSEFLSNDEQKARETVKRILDQFVCEGYVILRSFDVFSLFGGSQVWMAQRGAEYAVLEMITTSVN